MATLLAHNKNKWPMASRQADVWNPEMHVFWSNKINTSLKIICFFSLWSYCIPAHKRACTFLSPARRGRGILVAPGFCPASLFLVGAKTEKLLVNFFEILT